jgi:hypothetical protein
MNQGEIRQALSLLTPLKAVGIEKSRVGNAHDGGYILLDDLGRVNIVYSLGVGREVAFDLQMAERGCEVFMYDHTVEGPPICHERFRFAKVEIAKDDKGNKSRLSSIVQTNNHLNEMHMLLKMDIEGAEWELLPDVPLSIYEKFVQIAMEVHSLDRLVEGAFLVNFKNIFSRLRLTHFPIHIHGNNWAPLVHVHGVAIPQVLELTFARRTDFSFQTSHELYPTKLDAPNKADTPDFFLGSFEF